MWCGVCECDVINVVFCGMRTSGADRGFGKEMEFKSWLICTWSHIQASAWTGSEDFCMGVGFVSIPFHRRYNPIGCPLGVLFYPFITFLFFSKETVSRTPRYLNNQRKIFITGVI